MTTMLIEPVERKDWEIELLDLVKDHGDEITPQQILKHAEKKASALHSMFTWDDTEAAKQYRLIQAGSLIRRIKVKMITRDNEEISIRVLHSAHRADPNPIESPTAFVPIQTILKSPDMTNELLINAKRELAGFRRKYSILQELAGLFAAIDDVLATQA